MLSNAASRTGWWAGSAKPAGFKAVPRDIVPRDIVPFRDDIQLKTQAESLPRLVQSWPGSPKPPVLVAPADDGSFAHLCRRQGRFKYIIDSNAGLWIGESPTGHIDLAAHVRKLGLEPVMAGKLRVDGEKLVGYDNASGHFQPETTSERVQFTERVFANAFGNQVLGLYRSYQGSTDPDDPMQSRWTQIPMGGHEAPALAHFDRIAGPRLADDRMAGLRLADGRMPWPEYL